MKKYKVAVLDDYQNVALESADWSMLHDRADIAVFRDHLADPDAVIERLLPFDVVCVMRERTPLTRNVIERLPNLKLIASTGSANASIDVGGAAICYARTGQKKDIGKDIIDALHSLHPIHFVEQQGRPMNGNLEVFQVPSSGNFRA